MPNMGGSLTPHSSFMLEVAKLSVNNRHGHTAPKGVTGQFLINVIFMPMCMSLPGLGPVYLAVPGDVDRATRAHEPHAMSAFYGNATLPTLASVIQYRCCNREPSFLQAQLLPGRPFHCTPGSVTNQCHGTTCASENRSPPPIYFSGLTASRAGLCCDGYSLDTLVTFDFINKPSCKESFYPVKGHSPTFKFLERLIAA